MRLRQVASNGVRHRTILRLKGVVVPQLPNVVQVVRPSARIRAGGGGIRVMARTGSHTRDGLFQRVLRHGFAVQTIFVFARRPCVTNVRGRHSVRINGRARTVLSVNFCTGVARIISVNVFPVHLKEVTTQACATYEGNTRAINATSVRLFHVEYNHDITVQPCRPSNGAQNCRLILICPMVMPRFQIRLRRLYGECPRGLLSFLARQLTRGAMSNEDRIANQHGNNLPPSKIALTTRKDIIVDVNMLRNEGRLITRAGMRYQVLNARHVRDNDEVTRCVRYRPREDCAIPKDQFKLRIVDSVATGDRRLVVLNAIRLINVWARDHYDQRIVLAITRPEGRRTQGSGQDKSARFVAIRRKEAYLTHLPFMQAIRLRVPTFATARSVILHRHGDNAQSHLIVTLRNSVGVRLHVMKFVRHNGSPRVRYVERGHHVAQCVLRLHVARGASTYRALLGANLAMRAVRALREALTNGAYTILCLAFPPVALVIRPAMGRIKACQEFIMMVCNRTFMVRTIVKFLPLLSGGVSKFAPRARLLLNCL